MKPILLTLAALTLFMSSSQNSNSQAVDPKYTWDGERDALFKTDLDSNSSAHTTWPGIAGRIIGDNTIDINLANGRQTVTLLRPISDQQGFKRILSPGTPVWVQFFGTDRVSGHSLVNIYLNANCNPETSVSEILK